MNLYVIKRDGSVEQFENEKIAKVALAAGLLETQAARLCEEVQNYFLKNSQEKVTSLQIRDKVLDCMKEVNMYAANMFEWYEKTKEK
jgi:transcriptional regulator NrdR family protein